MRESNRLQYILRTLLNEGLGLETAVTTDPEVWKNSTAAKINYSDAVFENCINIKPHTVLFDHGIRDYHLEVGSHPVFFKVFFKGGGGDVPFDLLGAAFWLLSRYEEYLPHKGDAFNRFHYSSSVAYQYDFIQVPLVNVWLCELQRLLKMQNPEIQFTARKYNFMSSIDIDNVYKFKHKGFVRTIAGLLSDRSLAKMTERLRIVMNRAPDPFDCYDFLIEANKHAEVPAIYFFLLGDYGPNDKNHSASDLRFQALIKHVADYSWVGIHPSFGSNNNVRQLKVEVGRLNNITHRVITRSRQHFAVLKFPKTYQDLLEAGVFSDYSLGYTNQNGFRASYCYPFKWYSLDIEAASALTLHPFCISENTLIAHSKAKNKDMMELAKPIVEEVKKYGGQMISIFHNDSFSERIRKFYIEFINLAKEKT